MSPRVSPMKIPAADLDPCVTKLISGTVAQETGYKLGTVGGRQQTSSLSRRDEVVINRHRLRIGHTR